MKINKITTSAPRTVLSVYPDSLELNLGKDLDEKKLKPFLNILDELLTDMPEQKEPYYGHFKFSRNRVQVILSHNNQFPWKSDIAYERRW